MMTELIEKCDLLVENHKIIRESNRWESDLMMLAGASYYVGMGIEADREKLKNCNEILKRQAGILSDYRGNIKIPLICKMAVSEDPNRYLEAIKAIVANMKHLKWIEKQYKILAAITIKEHTLSDEYKPAVDKMTELYRGMKENHPWLTSSEDLPFAAILAVSDINADALLVEMENCYQTLKEFFFDKDAVQTLSHVLAAVNGEADAKCDKVKEIWDLLKEKNHKYSTGYELAVLGTLCSPDVSANLLVEEIIEADDYLKQYKGFGNLSLGKKTRLMYATLMVANSHIPQPSLINESLLGSSLAIVTAMEICMLVVVSSTAVTAANNS